MENVIYAYTREQAIEDGMLHDASAAPEVKEAGFKAPMALTPGVMQLVNVPESLKGAQDFKGRLWDTLFLAALAMRSQMKAHAKNPTPDTDPHLVAYIVSYQTAPEQHEDVTLWLAFNEAEGFTIMLPEEY